MAVSVKILKSFYACRKRWVTRMKNGFRGRTYASFLLWLALAIVTMCALLGVTNYVARIMHRDGQDRQEIYFRFEGIGSLGAIPGVTFWNELPEDISDAPVQSSLLVYNEKDPTSFWVLVTTGKYDLFEGVLPTISYDAGAVKERHWYGSERAHEAAAQEQILPELNSFLVDYSSFRTGTAADAFTEETVFYLVSYKEKYLEASYRKLQSYAAAHGMKCVELQKKQANAAAFLDGLAFVHVFLLVVLLSLFIMDIVGMVLYTKSRRPAARVYFLLGYTRYEWKIVGVMLGVKLILCGTAAIWLAVSAGTLVLPFIIIYYVPQLIAAVLIGSCSLATGKMVKA